MWRNVLPVQLCAQTNFLHYNFPWRIKVQLNFSDSDTCVLAPQQVLNIGKHDLADSREAQPVTSDLRDPDLSQQLAEHLHDPRVRKFASYSEVSHCKAIICLSDLFGLRWGLGSYCDKHKWRLAVFLERKKPPQREHNPSAHNFSVIHFSDYFFQSVLDYSKYWISSAASLLSPDSTDPGQPCPILSLIGICRLLGKWWSVLLLQSAWHIFFQEYLGSGSLAESSIVVIFYLYRASTHEVLENSNCLSPEQSQSLIGCHRQQP